jgi:hypothetical protein
MVTADCWFIIDLMTASSSGWDGLGPGTHYAVDPGVDAGHVCGGKHARAVLLASSLLHPL